MSQQEEILNLRHRISRLEETTYFQETSITELNEALTQQQQQLNAQEKQITELCEKMRTLLSTLEDGGQSTVPPHSLPSLY